MPWKSAKVTNQGFLLFVSPPGMMVVQYFPACHWNKQKSDCRRCFVLLSSKRKGQRENRIGVERPEAAPVREERGGPLSCPLPTPSPSLQLHCFHELVQPQRVLSEVLVKGLILHNQQVQILGREGWR